MSATPAVSLVLVAHRSASVLPAAVEAFRREAVACGLPAEVVVVEHSEDDEEARRVGSCAPDHLLRLPNRGYAAGVNAGIGAARGELLLAGNPDVVLAPGSLAALLAALRSGWGVVGPQFELAGAVFPPAERQTPWAEMARRRAWRSRRCWERYLRRELVRWRAVWEAAGPRAVPTLSGALLAFPAALARRVGSWDEGYFLYFEETEWLRRVRRAGAPLAVVPEAAASHRWGHSAPPAAWAGQFAGSRRRYYRACHPLLGRLALRVPSAPPPPAPPWEGAPEPAGWRWLLSPSPAGFPAALVEPGTAPARVAADFCAASGCTEVTLVGWRDGGRRGERVQLSGPYSWRPAGEARGARAPVPPPAG
jgi:GT2 family glycosyltransferase